MSNIIGNHFRGDPARTGHRSYKEAPERTAQVGCAGQLELVHFVTERS
jgi:hypothetical protein